MDIGSITSAATGLHTAGQILKSLVGLKIGTEVQSKVIELQTIIVGAQEDALAAQSEQLALLERIRKLESEVETAKAWERERDRYELKEFPTGVFAYQVKAAAVDGEPLHRICANCFQEGQKSILQVMSRERGGELVECHRCTKRFELSPFGPDPINYDRGAEYY